MKLESFKSEMDAWVKSLNSKMQEYSHIPMLVNENADNIDHNYEIIHEMRAEMRKLREELAAVRIAQLLSMKAELKKPKY
ncbi:hypothetical protein GF323_04995 [Candidatus Woesearchaeota archaeon]|nr:hypothetical protein [Candidatus Woesearchaeota archaeon]